MKKILSIFNKESKLNIFGILLISILPAALLSRSAVLNILILIINFFFFYLLYFVKKNMISLTINISMYCLFFGFHY